MTTALQICNQALDLLGHDPIMSLSENTEAGRLCNRNFGVTRDAVIRAYPWNVAFRRVSLLRSRRQPTWGFLYAYDLPDSCLRVWEVMTKHDWRVEGRCILTDEPLLLDIRYLAQLKDHELTDPLLAGAIAARMASDLAYRLTGSTSVSMHAWTTYQAKLAEARRVDVQEAAAAAATAA